MIDACIVPPQNICWLCLILRENTRTARDVFVETQGIASWEWSLMNKLWIFVETPDMEIWRCQGLNKIETQHLASLRWWCAHGLKCQGVYRDIRYRPQPSANGRTSSKGGLRVVCERWCVLQKWQGWNKIETPDLASLPGVTAECCWCTGYWKSAICWLCKRTASCEWVLRSR